MQDIGLNKSPQQKSPNRSPSPIKKLDSNAKSSPPTKKPVWGGNIPRIRLGAGGGKASPTKPINVNTIITPNYQPNAEKVLYFLFCMCVYLFLFRLISLMNLWIQLILI